MPPAVGPRSQFHILLFKDISLLKVVLQQLIINNFLSSEVIRTFKTGESSLNLCNKRSKTLLLIRISFSSSKQPTRHRISRPGSGVTKSLAAGNKTLKASSFLFSCLDENRWFQFHLGSLPLPFLFYLLDEVQHSTTETF